MDITIRPAGRLNGRLYVIQIHTADDQRGASRRGWTVAAAGNERRLEPISSSETNNSDSVL